MRWVKTTIRVGLGLLAVNYVLAYLNDRGSEDYPNPVFKEDN